MQVHKGRLRAVPQTELPLDIRLAAKRQRRPFNSWQLGLGPEVLYTPPTHSSAPAKVLAGGWGRLLALHKNNIVTLMASNAYSRVVQKPNALQTANAIQLRA